MNTKDDRTLNRVTVFPPPLHLDALVSDLYNSLHYYYLYLYNKTTLVQFVNRRQIIKDINSSKATVGRTPRGEYLG